MGKVAQIAMGAGIGVGVCLKLKKTQPLVVASAVAAGMIGSYAQAIISGIRTSMESGNAFAIALSSAGDPMGAFVGAFAAMTLASLVSGRTRVDILVTPLVGLAGGALFGIGVGYPVSLALTELGNFIAWAASLSTVSAAVTGLIVSVVMGVALTLPISSAAIGISIGLSGVAAGAAVVGCCCQMMGFAAMSFRENRWGGFVAQGLGTSMLQIPNVFKKPVLFVPPIISSAILGTLSVFLPNGAGIGLFATRTGSGMGTAGLVGPIDMLFEMIGAQGCNVGLTILWVVLFCFVLPALLTLAIAELFRKFSVVRDRNHEPVARKALQQRKDILTRCLVQRAGGFVRKNYLRVFCCRPRYGYALALPARKLCNFAAGKILQSHKVQSLFRRLRRILRPLSYAVIFTLSVTLSSGIRQYS